MVSFNSVGLNGLQSSNIQRTFSNRAPNCPCNCSVCSNSLSATFRGDSEPWAWWMHIMEMIWWMRLHWVFDWWQGCVFFFLVFFYPFCCEYLWGGTLCFRNKPACFIHFSTAANRRVTCYRLENRTIKQACCGFFFSLGTVTMCCTGLWTWFLLDYTLFF